MSDDLVQRVGRWLDAVPHSATCRLVAPAPTYAFGYCDCDRAQRQAEAVVRLAREAALTQMMSAYTAHKGDVFCTEFIRTPDESVAASVETLERQETTR